MRDKILSGKILFIIVGILLLSLSTQTLAQHRRVEKRPTCKSVKVVKPPTGHKNVVVKGKNYRYHKGVFYKKGPTGYVVIRGPIGARIGILPAGYLTVRIGGLMYYNYYDTYYRYDPIDKVYIVIEKPEAVQASTLDVITLVNGDVLEGIYLGGTRSTVQIEIEGEINEIDVVEIVSISFAPAVE